MAVAHCVEEMRGVDARHRERVHVKWVVERRSQRDHLLDQVGLAMRENLGEHSSAAVADDGDARAGLAMEREQGVEERFQHDLGIHHVEGEAGELGPVAHAFQPVELRAQSPVAGQEAGDEQDGPAQTRGDVVAAEDGVADQAEKLE